MEEVHKKLDKLDGRLDSIDVTLVKQASELEKHIYRTELAERRLDRLDELWIRFDKHLTRIEFLAKLIIVGVPIVVGALAIHKYITGV